MSNTLHTQETALFATTLAHYKKMIDADIAQYAKTLEQQTLTQYGANSRLEIDAYLSILQRGGKRIRGSLAIAAYTMAGGKDMQLIMQVARVIEMMHAYILIIDDFQDRSHVRRGGPAAHTILAQYHRRNELAGDAEHFGASIALNAALSGSHLAQIELAKLDIPAERKLEVIDHINRTMVVTAHGQTNDIINEVVAEVSPADIDRVLEWKTAHYTFLNPLTVGLILAGASRASLLTIHDYAIHAGKAFQITDDILGIFGSEFESGKSPMDDIREGKRTVITAYALQHSNNDNKNFVVQMLGNANLTPVEFERCKDILVESGALAFAEKSARHHVALANESIASIDETWSPEGIAFLRGLTLSMLNRTA